MLWAPVSTSVCIDRFMARGAARMPPKCRQNEEGKRVACLVFLQAMDFIEVLVVLRGLDPGLFALRGYALAWILRR
jgi:hypothetical protein